MLISKIQLTPRSLKQQNLKQQQFHPHFTSVINKVLNQAASINLTHHKNSALEVDRVLLTNFY